MFMPLNSLLIFKHFSKPVGNKRTDNSGNFLITVVPWHPYRSGWGKTIGISISSRKRIHDSVFSKKRTGISCLLSKA
jgi:chitinase